MKKLLFTMALIAGSFTLSAKEKNSGTTLKLADVTPATQALRSASSTSVVKKALGHSGFETFATTHQKLIYSRTNPFISASRYAFAKHYPLTLSPDIVWINIVQGFSRHINLNPEKYRKQIVDFKGKKSLTIIRNDFIKGSTKNKWLEVMSEFSKKIHAELGKDYHQMLIADFSTTGSIEKTASEIALMSSVDKYFTYNVDTLCGIPSITFEGSPEDWRKLKAKVEKMATYDLQWWTKKLIPVIDEFIKTSENKGNKEFWCSYYHEQGHSGGPDEIDGHILAFFPYILNKKSAYVQNPYFTKKWDETIKRIKKMEAKHKQKFTSFLPKIEITRIPSGICSVPFKWNFPQLKKYYEMKLYSGFMGIYQDPKTLALRPEIGWGIRQIGGAKKIK